MSLVKVWNDNKFPYSEEFKGQKILIAPKSFIMMDAGEAHLFRGTYSPMIPDSDGKQKPESYKMIRIEVPSDHVVETPKVLAGLKRCNLCGYESESQADLMEHSKATHADLFVVDPELDKQLANKNK